MNKTTSVKHNPVQHSLRYMGRAASAVMLLAVAGAASAAQPLRGYFYGDEQSPGGHEWECPDSLAYNKEQPRAWFFSFDSKESAKKVLPEHSAYRMSLDGTWKFRWVNTPGKRVKGFENPSYDTSGWDDIEVPSNWNIAGLQKEGSQRYGKPIYVNQKVIFKHRVKVDDWRGGVMRTPPESWTTYEDRNEVGQYRREFTVPDSWTGREVYIDFDGVDSFFYLWVNGRYVGFSKNSRNAARFDITPYIKKGVNTVSVEVYRNSDGSFLEAQDMFRLPGIFRSVSLTSVPKVHVRDLVAVPDLDGTYTHCELKVKADVRNLGAKDAKGLRLRYSLYPVELYGDSTPAAPVSAVTTDLFKLGSGSGQAVSAVVPVESPRLWSAEAPWRYVLVGELLNAKGEVVETVSTYTGLRKVEIKDTPAVEDEFGLAGRYFYLNGKPVKMKGVNRHETDPERGHALTRATMENDIMLMKAANINHVRNCHYPDAPYWYCLCDKYGIMLEDEANLESHEYYYWDESLSHVSEFEAAHVARNMEMVHATVNHPSVVIWSLGNEAGPGVNFERAYEAIKAFDTSRPVQYERNNDIVDMGSNQYPSVAWVEWAATGETGEKYPFHISEYAHSMGNALGNLADYWRAIESTNFIMGGAIWDWKDQSLYNHDPETGERYLAFGGDFGDRPTDGQFVMNGILSGDSKPKPEYREVKKVYQNVAVKPVDLRAGVIDIFNKNYYEPLAGYDIEWSLSRDGGVQAQGVLSDVTVDPRSHREVTLPLPAVEAGAPGLWTVEVRFAQRDEKPWARAGYVQMEEQMVLHDVSHAAVAATAAAPVAVETDGLYIVSGDGFEAKFDMTQGVLESLSYDGQPVIVPGCGPRLDAWRAYINNDEWIRDEWFAKGLYNLRHRLVSARTGRDADGNAVVVFDIESQALRGGKMTGGNGNACGTYGVEENDSVHFGPNDYKLVSTQTWTVMGDGTLLLETEVVGSDGNAVLPRLGMAMEVPAELDRVTYLGRGPEENYNDRMTSQNLGLYTNTVSGMAVRYTRPQHNGNREEVRWAELGDGKRGLRIEAVANSRAGGPVMSFGASPWSEAELFMTDHDYKLPETGRSVVHMDLGVTGLGGASCGQGGPLEPDRVTDGHSVLKLRFAKSRKLGVGSRELGVGSRE